MRTLPATTAILVIALHGCAGVTVPRAAIVVTSRPAARAARIASRTSPSPAPAPVGPPIAVGERTVTFVDTSRTVRFPGRPPEPRTLVTVIRYPALGPSSRVDLPNAPPARAAGRFPLVIFGHGFAVTPAPYAPLLQAWAQAGYVVAAPIFPLGNGRDRSQARALRGDHAPTGHVS